MGVQEEGIFLSSVESMSIWSGKTLLVTGVVPSIIRSTSENDRCSDFSTLVEVNEGEEKTETRRPMI